MASFLLIHGAWHGGWAFDRLRPMLEAAGHATAAPDLPGMGARAAVLGKVTLRGWADFVIEAARALPPPVILCGHSRGGIILSVAAERAPERFAALVYIAAFLNPDGRSLNDMAAAMPRDPLFAAGLTPVGHGAGVTIAPQAAIHAFYNGCAPEDQQASAARLVTEPLRPFAEPVRVSAARFGRVPRHYVECLDDRTIPLAAQRAMQAALPCASVTTLGSGHSPFLSMPDALARALLTIAQTIRERSEA